MDELVQWLGEQLDEDERIAEEAGGRRAEWRLARPLDDAELGDASWLRPPELKHAERHDPARVLREVDAKRAVLKAFAEVARHYGRDDVEYADGWVSGLAFAVQHIATAYSDRPGYREDWRPRTD